MKRHLKGLAGAALLRSGMYSRSAGDAAVVAVFHRIDDRYPHSPITCGRAEFELYCRFFARYFKVVSFVSLLDDLKAGNSLAGKLAITFDDGYLDNFTVAAPLLSDLGLPATFFVSTGFLGTSRVPHWDVTASIATEWMSWSHISQLRSAGFAIGAHTVNHVHLGRTVGDPARDEIVGAKIQLEQNLGEAVDLFSLPYGGRDDYSASNRDLVREAGFRCSPFCFGGRVRRGDDPFSLARAPISQWYRGPNQFALELLFD